MPTVAELKRLEALVGQLSPLATAQRGQRIRSQDWNVLVDALIEVAQLALARDTADEAQDHTHADQVKLSWLAPALRRQIQRGPLSDPANVAKLCTLERELERRRAQVDRLGEKILQLRGQLLSVQTRDLIREKDVLRVSRELDGMADSGREVLALRDTLSRVQGELKRAMLVAKNLEVDGEVLHAGALVDRLSGLEEVHERLKLPTGELLDGVRFEQRMTELTNTLVTEKEMDARLEQHDARLSDEQRAAVEEDVREAVLAVTERQIAELGKKLARSVAQALGDVDGVVAKALSDAVPDIEAGLVARVKPLISAAMKQTAEAVRVDIKAQLDRMGEALAEDCGRKIEGLAERLPGAIRAAVGTAMTKELSGIRRRLDALDDGMRRLSETASGTSREVGALAEQVGGLLAEVEERDRKLAATLREEFDGKLAAVIKRLSVNRDPLRRREGIVVDGRLDRVAVEVREAAATAARNEMRIAEARLLGEMRDIARDETAAAADDVRRELTTLRGAAFLAPTPTTPEEPDE